MENVGLGKYKRFIENNVLACPWRYYLIIFIIMFSGFICLTAIMQESDDSFVYYIILYVISLLSSHAILYAIWWFEGGRTLTESIRGLRAPKGGWVNRLYPDTFDVAFSKHSFRELKLGFILQYVLIQSIIVASVYGLLELIISWFS